MNSFQSREHGLCGQGVSQDDGDIHNLKKAVVIWAIPKPNAHQFTIPLPESLHQDKNRFPFSGMPYQMPESTASHHVQASSNRRIPDFSFHGIRGLWNHKGFIKQAHAGLGCLPRWKPGGLYDLLIRH